MPVCDRCRRKLDAHNRSAAKTRAARVRKKKCYRCGKKSVSNARWKACSTCREKMRLWREDAAIDATMRGDCSRCLKFPAAEGKKCCQTCLDTERARLNRNQPEDPAQQKG